MSSHETPQTGTSYPNKYDFLFDESLDSAEPEIPRLPELDERQQALFAPLPYHEEEARVQNYDWLFDPNLPQPETSVSAAAAPDKGRQPTEKSITAAMEEVVDPTLDIHVRDLLLEYADPATYPRGVVERVHTDADLRFALARYFLAKIEANLSKMPRRVAINQQKNPNHPGYPGYITGREYAALLAISMLDGSFDQESVGRGDDITYTKDTREEVVLGQHRAAANLLLHND